MKRNMKVIVLSAITIGGLVKAGQITIRKVREKREKYNDSYEE